MHFDPAFSAWVLQTIRDRLRPRILIYLGLRANREAGRFLEQAFDGFNLNRPHAEHRLDCYRERRLTFRAWEIKAPAGNHL